MAKDNNKPAKPLGERLEQVYYTAAQARAVLGMGKDAFNYWVRIGKVQKRTLTGKHGVYAKKDIDSLAAKIEAMMIADMPELTFRRATVADLEAENHLAYLALGAYMNTPEVKQARRAYLETNPNFSWHLYEDEKLVAYLNILPLKPEAIDAFLGGQRAFTIDAHMIEQFAPGHPLQCIIIDFVTASSVAPEKRRHYGAFLLMELAQVFRGWGSQGVEIVRICAASRTRKGIQMLEKAGFQFVADTWQGRWVYALDPLHSDLKLLHSYQQALAEWQSTHPDRATLANLDETLNISSMEQ